MELDAPAFSEQEEEDYILLVLLGIITLNNLSVNYQIRIEGILNDALTQGFGGAQSDFDENSSEYLLYGLFLKNVNNFTAAKQYQQVRDMSAFLSLDRDAFFEKAREIFSDYNDNWLATEFDTAVNTAKAGKRWAGFERGKKTKPMLTYNTQRDSRVRPEHTALDRITRPVDDPFWDRYAPPNGWNCRCFLTSSASKEATPENQLPIKELDKEVPEMFQTNPAKTGMVFNNMHPYFSVRRGDAALRRNNFNIVQ